MSMQTRHHRLMKEHVDPADEFDFQALKMALQFLAAVVIVVLAMVATDGGDAAVPGPGAADQPRNHASIERTTAPSRARHAQA